MLALPIKQYNRLAKAFHKKGITAKDLYQQLEASNNFLVVNGTKVKVSRLKLVERLKGLELQRLKGRVDISAVRAQVLEREYFAMISEGKL